MWAGGSCEGQGGFGPFLEGPGGENDARRLDWCPTCRRSPGMSGPRVNHAASVRRLPSHLYAFRLHDVDLSSQEFGTAASERLHFMNLAFELPSRWAGSSYTPLSTGGLTGDRNIRRPDRCHF